MGLGVLLGLVLLAAPAAGPSVAQEQLLETLIVPLDGSTATGTTQIASSADYKIRFRNTVQAASGGFTESWDAFYCFQSNRPDSSCNEPQASRIQPVQFWVGSPSAPPQGSFASFSYAGAYTSSHDYTAPGFGSDSGTFSVRFRPSLAELYAISAGPFGPMTADLYGPAGSGGAPLPAEGEAAISALFGDVKYRDGGGEWRPLRKGTKLRKGHELATGIDAAVVLVFADGTRIGLDEMTQVLISTLVVRESRITARISLTLGRLDATINPQKAFQSDFKVQTEGFSGVPRGTKFAVFHDAGAKASIVSVTQHSVLVDPVGEALADVVVPAGHEVEVRAKAVSPVVDIGRAGARGGLNRVRARDLVLARIHRARRRCRLKATRHVRAVSLRPVEGGWRVAVRVTGRARGVSSWSVKKRKAKPLNKVARKINRRCR